MSELKAVGYVRVSTDEQAKEGVSLDNQRQRIELFAKLRTGTFSVSTLTKAVAVRT